MDNILDIKYNEIREIEKQHKLFIIKLHILLLTIDKIILQTKIKKQ